jgi:hypothetical protein
MAQVRHKLAIANHGNDDCALLEASTSAQVASWSWPGEIDRAALGVDPRVDFRGEASLARFAREIWTLHARLQSLQPMGARRASGIV